MTHLSKREESLLSDILKNTDKNNDGLSFNNEEKEFAENASVVNNYTNNFYSDAKTTRISQGNSIEKKENE